MSAATDVEGPQIANRSDGDTRQAVRDLVRRIERHPYVVVGVVSGLIALGHAVWVWNHRYVGGLDPDEAGYLANAFRYQRSIGWNPIGPMHAFGSTGTGPLVPALSLPLLVLGPDDPRTAMMIQPVLMVVLALAVTATTRRLSRPWIAVAAGLSVSMMLTVWLATQSYWLGLGAATSAAVATAALVWSDRLTNRWTWVFAVAVACTVLSRTMAMAYVPGLAIAGAVVAGRDLHRWKRLLVAAAISAVIVGPWLLVNREGIFGYLFSYGFGERAGHFGSGGVLSRLDLRVDRLLEGTGWPGPVLLLVGAAAVGGVIVLGARLRRGERPDAMRLGVALAAGAAVSVGLLVSTTNNGVWFELPMLAFLVPLAWAAIGLAPRPAALIVTCVVVAAGASLLPDSWWLREFRPGAPTSHYENGFAQYDERFSATRRDEHRAASDDWAALNRSVARWMSEQGAEDQRPWFTLSGNMQLFNSNSVLLAAELAGVGLNLDIPDTGTPIGEQREWLTPTREQEGRQAERILLIAHHDDILFTPDLDVDRFAALAEEAGWRPVRSFRFPTSGEVVAYRHPDNG